MTKEKKRKLHPIVEKALKMAYQGIEPVEFDDYAVEQIQELLRERFGKSDLVDAVMDLINLAGLLNEQGCRSASLKILMAVSITADALKDLNESRKNTSNE